MPPHDLIAAKTLGGTSEIGRALLSATAGGGSGLGPFVSGWLAWIMW